MLHYFQGPGEEALGGVNKSTNCTLNSAVDQETIGTIMSLHLYFKKNISNCFRRKSRRSVKVTLLSVSYIKLPSIFLFVFDAPLVLQATPASGHVSASITN